MKSFLSSTFRRYSDFKTPDEMKSLMKLFDILKSDEVKKFTEDELKRELGPAFPSHLLEPSYINRKPTPVHPFVFMTKEEIKHKESKYNVYWVEHDNMRNDTFAEYEKMRKEIQELRNGCFVKMVEEESDYAPVWVKPPPGSKTINGDCSWYHCPDTKQMKATIAGAVRDASGKLCKDLQNPIFIRQAGTCTEPESLCMLDMLTFMLLNKFEQFTIESSFETVIRDICEDVYVDDDRLKITLSILLLLHNEQCEVTIAWVDKDRNNVAGMLSKYGQMNSKKELNELKEAPSCVKDVIEDEASKDWRLNLKDNKLRKIKYVFRGKK